MSIMLAALNQNITDEQLIELIKVDGDAKLRSIETLREGMDKMETPEQKMKYLEACMPVVIMLMAF